jgi:hypothetical protein
VRNFIDIAASDGLYGGVIVRSFLRSLGRHAAVWLRTCADHYAAAAMYERLSGLSDAELCRRGLARADLGRHACKACSDAYRSS